MSETDAIEQWLGGKSFDDWRADFDRDGFIQFHNVLATEKLVEVRAALAPYLDAGIQGRNEFEGLDTNRVYALLAKGAIFAELATHPLALAFVEADLGEDCLLSAFLAINLHPGETAQPWHFDDSHYLWPRPRPSLGVSVFWTIDETTEDNGATEILPGSHLWPDDVIAGSVGTDDFERGKARKNDIGGRPDIKKAIMPAGSLMLAKGTLWHRGGANRAGDSRLILTPQYCPGWTRQLENMAIAVPPEIAKTLPKRARELIGYSIHPPFMGYVDGRHPERKLGI